MKKYTRKPLRFEAFRWDGEPNEHVKLLGKVRGDLGCKQCTDPWEKHGELTSPYDSVYSILCVGRMVLIREGGTTEFMSEAQFRHEYEEGS